MTEIDDDKIVKAVEFSAPIARVWRALTDHQEFGQWFRLDLDQPFEPGAKSTGQMTYPGFEDVRWIAYVERMEPKRLFSFRWYDGDDETKERPTDEPGLLVEFHLQEFDAGTRVTIIESGFSTLPEPRRSEALRDNTEGWDLKAQNLTEYLST